MPNDSKSSSKRGPRLLSALATALVLVFIFWLAGKAGISRFLGRYSLITANPDVAARVTGMTPMDPEAHKVRALVLHDLKRLPEAAAAYELALSVRPRDDSLWLQLGMLRDELGDAPGALPAFNESVRLAPFYALPRWQRGNFLLRQGRLDEAFADLRQAAMSNPDYIPSLIDLSWGISKGNREVAETYAGITTSQKRLAFAEFLARQGKGSEAVEQFTLAGSVPGQKRNELVRQLIAANAFREAFQIWGSDKIAKSGEPAIAIYDGGFEGPLGFEEFGFGWRVYKGTQNIKPAADSSVRASGSKSLMIEFLGDSNPEIHLLSQMILVKSSTRYRLSFSARTQQIVAGGLPVAVIIDSGSRKRLAESPALSQNSTDWQVVSFDFHTQPETVAITLSIQRKHCTTSPCPIFGAIWLDSFSIEEWR